MQYPLTEEELIENSWPISLTSEGNEYLAEYNLCCFTSEALQVIHATKRALWLARAERARTELSYWCVLAYYFPCKKFNVKHSIVENKIMKHPAEWKSWWFHHEEKCLKKAEEYK